MVRKDHSLNWEILNYKHLAGARSRLSLFCDISGDEILIHKRRLCIGAYLNSAPPAVIFQVSQMLAGTITSPVNEAR